MTKQELLNLHGENAAVNASAAAGVGFDPAVIIAIITSLIGLFTGGCKPTPPKAAMARARKPGPLGNLMLGQVVGEHVSDPAHVPIVMAAVREEMRRVNERDMTTLFAP